MNVHALDAPSSLALRCFACGVDHPPVQSRSPTCALRRSATLAQLPPEQAASSHTFMRRSHPPVNFLQSIAGKGTRSKLSAGGGAFWLCPPAPGACLLLAAPLRLDRTTCSSHFNEPAPHDVLVPGWTTTTTAAAVLRLLVGLLFILAPAAVGIPSGAGSPDRTGTGRSRSIYFCMTDISRLDWCLSAPANPLDDSFALAWPVLRPIDQSAQPANSITLGAASAGRAPSNFPFRGIEQALIPPDLHIGTTDTEMCIALTQQEATFRDNKACFPRTPPHERLLFSVRPLFIDMYPLWRSVIFSRHRRD